MKTPLQNQFETQLRSLTGFDFQIAVTKIFQWRYGETGFTVIRLQKDKGNDGIVESEKRVIACFGPGGEKNSTKRLNGFKEKVSKDFDLYKTHWQSNYPNWSVVINHQIDPQYDTFVKELMPNATVIGLEQLLLMIDNLRDYQKRRLGEEFRIDKEYFSVDYLKDFLEDLLKETEISEKHIKYDGSTYVQFRQKVELNYDATDIEAAISEYSFFAEEGYLKQVEDLMAGYEDEEINIMKTHVIEDYKNKTNGNFKERLKLLSDYYLSTYSSSNDGVYLHCINVVLIYLFEQCLIGVKTKGT
jgi:hypothetical protein